MALAGHGFLIVRSSGGWSTKGLEILRLILVLLIKYTDTSGPREFILAYSAQPDRYLSLRGLWGKLVSCAGLGPSGEPEPLSRFGGFNGLS
jgi:hypothetical protein